MLTHKELLTFSNLTNLKWEFVELYDKTTGRKKDNTFLRDLLTPKVFYKEDEEENEFGDNINYIYGKRDRDGEYLEETGQIELRRNAGIAMEYLEKIGTDNKEGDFLKDWEVIYGGDNYQVVADYINNKWSRLCQFLNSIDETLNLDEREKIDPGRESIEDLFDISVSDNLEVIDCNNYLTFNGAFV